MSQSFDSDMPSSRDMANYLSSNSRSLSRVVRTLGPNETTSISDSMVFIYRAPARPEPKVHIRAKDQCPAR